MSKSIKRRNIKRRKTRRRKCVKGGRRAAKAELFVWQDSLDDTLHKRFFVDDAMNLRDAITDAGYNLRFLDQGFADTIPRKEENKVPINTNPFIKTMTADYGGDKADVLKEVGASGSADVNAKVVVKAEVADAGITDRLNKISEAINAGDPDSIKDNELKRIFTTKSKPSQLRRQLQSDGIKQLLTYIKTGKSAEEEGDEEKL